MTSPSARVPHWVSHSGLPSLSASLRATRYARPPASSLSVVSYGPHQLFAFFVDRPPGTLATMTWPEVVQVERADLSVASEVNETCVYPAMIPASPHQLGEAAVGSSRHEGPRARRRHGTARRAIGGE